MLTHTIIRNTNPSLTLTLGDTLMHIIIRNKHLSHRQRMAEVVLEHGGGWTTRELGEGYVGRGVRGGLGSLAPRVRIGSMWYVWVCGNLVPTLVYGTISPLIAPAPPSSLTSSPPDL